LLPAVKKSPATSDYGRRFIRRRQLARLPVEPNVLKAPIVIDAVLALDMSFQVRMPARIGDIVGYDWIGDVLGELALDCPNQPLAQSGARSCDRSFSASGLQL
jgi:hypothetical protein